VKATVINFSQVDAIGSQVNAGGQIGAPGFYPEVRAFFAEEFPEVNNFFTGIKNFLPVELFPVEDSSGGSPGFHAKAKPIAEPDIVESQIGQEMLGLPAKESTEGSILRNALGKTCVG